MTIEMKYTNYKAEEFCEDANFIQWVLNPTDESDTFWAAFLTDNPNQQKEVQLATKYIKTLRFQEIDPSKEDMAALKNRIWQDIETHPLSIEKDEMPPLSIRRWWTRPTYWAAAASIFLVLTAGLFWWYQQPSLRENLYKTAYGQTQKIELLDGSVVTLNAHSTLKVAADLAHQQVREVWLDGEAYFKIAKLDGAKFIVHTTEAEVEVLGTEFNVNTRRQETKVILHEGKVKLSAANKAPVIMKAGDMAIVADKKEPIELKVVEPKKYDYWRDSVIVLNDKTVFEIAQMLEDNYGLTIQFDNKEMLNKKLTGSLPLKSKEEFVENFAIILDAEAEKTAKGYLFK
jgi:transmembrane sensor